MIQELLDLATFQSGERLRLRLEEFDLQDVAKEVCDQLTVRHGPRFQLMGDKPRVSWVRAATPADAPCF